MKKSHLDQMIRKSVARQMRLRRAKARRKDGKAVHDVDMNSKLTPLGLRYAKGFIRYSKQILQLTEKINANTTFKEMSPLLLEIAKRVDFLGADLRKFMGAMKKA